MVMEPSGTDPPRGKAIGMQKHPSRRRKSASRGTIAAYGYGRVEVGGPVSGEQLTNGGGDGLAENSARSPGPSALSSSSGSKKQLQHPPDQASGPSSKPCHSARIALLCAQNAIRMGAMTQMNLCPPGRPRRELQAALKQRRAHQRMSGKRISSNSDISSVDRGYYSLERMLGPESLEDYEAQEDDFLLNADAFGVESDEEGSSGDEDELNETEQLFLQESPALNDEEKYLNLREPLFTPVGGLESNPNGAPMSSIGTGNSGKLPFNRRKLRYFDCITAGDRAAARLYMQQENKRAKKRAALVLSQHLRREQEKERRRVRRERGESISDLSEANNETPEEKALLLGGIGQFPSHPVNSSTAAAMLLESLTINPLESLEGMSKCYAGIVAAGVALVDSQTIDPTSPTAEDKTRPKRSEIMAALEPLLITSLEQPAGEVILALAKLRRMCGTVRYQRRFVQRIAPSLIRPPRGAMWCLRHQNDMEAILAAAELIFDSAFDIFSKGWHERGRLLLADSKRAGALNSAAMQLRNLSSEPSDGLVLGLSTLSKKRRLMGSSIKKNDGSGSSSEHLAEWEVIAVDRQIRVSISNVLSTDWSRTAIKSEVPKPYLRRQVSSGSIGRPGILPTNSYEASPKAISSPRSPTRKLTAKAPLSPPSMPPTTVTSSSAPENNMENIFGSSAFSSDSPSSASRPLSPPPPNPSSPSQPQSKASREPDSRSDPLETSNTTYSVSTPPRSPRSPMKQHESLSKSSETPQMLKPLSPKRGKAASSNKNVNTSTQGPSIPTPLSPSSLSLTASGSSEIMQYKPSTTSTPVVSGSSTAAQHYRMLTSTAAERKRTVAACRALRAQIQRFEDAFIQLHGRPPKGASERAPLATTYAQYREWKRAIRSDAACRIQSLFRGAGTRMMLLRSNNPDIARVVSRKAGRRGYNEIHLSLPEIGLTSSERSQALPVISTQPGKDSNLAQPVAPPWARNVVRGRPNSQSNEGSFPSSTSAKPTSPASSVTSDYSNLSLAELQQKKRDLKQQLKQYDMTFARKHCRMPVKAEKEPIRHLYEGYNALKKQITLMEQEGRTTPQSPVSHSQSSASTRATASPSSIESGHSVSDEPLVKSSPRQSRNKSKLPKPSSPPISVTSTGAPPQDLASLKAEKAQLHQMLRSFEKDFFREHKRQVSSFADIRPVASQYRRYKEIKKAIAALQKGGERSS